MNLPFQVIICRTGSSLGRKNYQLSVIANQSHSIIMQVEDAVQNRIHCLHKHGSSHTNTHTHKHTHTNTHTQTHTCTKQCCATIDHHKDIHFAAIKNSSQHYVLSHLAMQASTSASANIQLNNIAHN